jgi:hypothetical protein
MGGARGWLVARWGGEKIMCQPLWPWECRLCAAKRSNRELLHDHLRTIHGRKEGLDANLRLQLLASVDNPEWSKNTMGYYAGEELVAVHIVAAERAVDDPMRLG